MTSSIQKPALVLVHGAWHNPTCFSHLIPHLTSLGYTTISTPTLPSANGGLPPSSTSTSSSSTNEKEEDEFPIWKADVSAVRTAVSALVENQELDVVVILHSYGGTPGTEALKGLAKKERVAKGEKGGVVALVYMAAFVIEEGKSTNGDAEADPLDVDFVAPGVVMVKQPIPDFYNDLPLALAQSCVETLHPQAIEPFAANLTYAAYKNIPSTYLICEKDEAIKVGTQEAFVKRLGEAAVVERCASAHSPFLSMPGFVAEVIDRAAGRALSS